MTGRTSVTPRAAEASVTSATSPVGVRAAASVTAASGAGPPGAPTPAPVPALARNWPVGARPHIARPWVPPATPYASGHRGIDLTAPSGAPVRSVAAGRVTFAGRVAGRGVITVELHASGSPPLRTTYEPVQATVHPGDHVTAAQIVGELEGTGSHCAATPCLHWGLLRGDTYLNPLSLLPPALLWRGPSRLLPVAGVREEVREARGAEG
ncbi:MULTISPECIES: M23 family metallopeptidase [unclassified Streptomyces]|uniref:M23 family metallopeptidase n=1 Tax=unclassified Streptomyces TaxID=2593676 RepID=UPI00381A3350